jgi:acetyl/propionyl-CoA carboxylase alpha subunit
MKLSAELAGREAEVTIEDAGQGRYRVVIVDASDAGGGRERLVDARRLGPSTWSLLLDGEVVTVDVDPGKDGELLCDVRGMVVPVRLVDARRRLLEKAQAVTGAGAKGPLVIVAPMPGKVVKLLVKAGDAVAANQPVAVVEAMKMENEIRSSRAGSVDTVHVKEGQTVEAQESLVTVA